MSKCHPFHLHYNKWYEIFISDSGHVNNHTACMTLCDQDVTHNYEFNHTS